MWGMPHSPLLYGNWDVWVTSRALILGILVASLTPVHLLAGFVFQLCGPVLQNLVGLYLFVWIGFRGYVVWVGCVGGFVNHVRSVSLPSLHGNWDGWFMSWALIVVILTLPTFIRGILNRVARVAESCDCCLFIFCGNRGSGVMPCGRVVVLLFLLEKLWTMWGMWHVPLLYGNWDGWSISCALLASILLGSLTLLTFSQDCFLNHVVHVAEPCNLMCFCVEIGVRWLCRVNWLRLLWSVCWRICEPCGGTLHLPLYGIGLGRCGFETHHIWTTSSEERVLVEGEGRQPLHGLHQAVQVTEVNCTSVWIPRTPSNTHRKERAEAQKSERPQDSGDQEQPQQWQACLN